MTNAEKEILADRLIKKLESLGYVVSFRKTTNVKYGLKKIKWSVAVWKPLTSKRTNDIKVQMMYVDAKHWTPKQGLVKRNMLDDMLRTIENKQAFDKSNSFFRQVLRNSARF